MEDWLFGKGGMQLSSLTVYATPTMSTLNVIKKYDVQLSHIVFEMNIGAHILTVCDLCGLMPKWEMCIWNVIKNCLLYLYVLVYSM